MNKTTLTAVGRAFWCNLVTAQKPKDGQDGVPKFGFTMLFPKNGITTPTGAGDSGLTEIRAALDEVCQGQWQMPFEGAAAAMNIPNGFKIKDGDVDFPKKDDQGIPIQPLSPSDNMAGHWVVSFRNVDPIGCAQPTAVAGVQENIEAAAVYGGCWVRAQVEFAAYKGSHGFVLSGKLLNILKCYDDTPIGGGKAAVSSADNAFSGMTVTGTNVQHGTNLAVQGAAGALSTPPTPPTPPVNNVPVVEAVLTTKAGSQYTVEQLLGLKWTEQQIIDAGHGEMIMAAAPKPPTPPTPPAPPTPPPVLTAPVGELTMKAGCQYTYAQLKPTYTDQQMVEAGFAEAPNFRDPTTAGSPPPPPPA